jgi:heme-binding HmuY-like protein
MILILMFYLNHYTPMLFRSVRPAALITLALSLSACGDDELSAPPTFEGTLTVNASTGWGYASLADSMTVTPADPATSLDWDIAFNATRVMLNGGAAGPGGVSAYCICQNTAATDAQVVAMTPEGELADFEAVDASDIPATGPFVTDSLLPAVRGWFDGTGAAATAVPGTTFLLRLDDDTSFAKVRVLSLTGPSTGDAGTVRIEYALQVNSAAPFGPPDTIDLSAGTSTLLDLNAGATVTSGTAWDLKTDGWRILVNSGVSGGGKVGVSPTTTPFADITTAALPAQAYSTDGFGGVFAGSPWYRYNIDPSAPNHIHPTFNVYLVKRGSEVYRVQLINYYGPAGETRRITFRFTRIAE